MLFCQRIGNSDRVGRRAGLFLIDSLIYLDGNIRESSASSHRLSLSNRWGGNYGKGAADAGSPLELEFRAYKSSCCLVAFNFIVNYA